METNELMMMAVVCVLALIIGYGLGHSNNNITGNSVCPMVECQPVIKEAIYKLSSDNHEGRTGTLGFGNKDTFSISLTNADKQGSEFVIKGICESYKKGSVEIRSNTEYVHSGETKKFELTYETLSSSENYECHDFIAVSTNITSCVKVNK